MASAFPYKKTGFLYFLFETSRDLVPEYSDALFIIKYHMRSVLESLKAIILRNNK